MTDLHQFLIVCFFGAAIPWASAKTDIFDIGNPSENNDSIPLQLGLNVSYSEGAVGSGSLVSFETGSSFSIGTDFMINIKTTDNNGGGAGLNSGTWTNFGYVHLKFSSGVTLNQEVGLYDFDGLGSSVTARDQGGIIAFHSGTRVNPVGTSAGDDVLIGSRVIKNTPSSLGFSIDDLVLESATATGNVAAYGPSDPEGQYSVDFGDRPLTDLLYFYQIPGTVGSGYNDTQRLVIAPFDFDLVTPIPEPSAGLFCLATVFLMGWRRRR